MPLNPDAPRVLKKFGKAYTLTTLSETPTVGGAKELKHDAIEIFDDVKFKLLSWNSNVTELESDGDESETTLAKEQLSVTTTGTRTKLLGLSWEKATNLLQVTLPNVPAVLTKRGVLG